MSHDYWHRGADRQIAEFVFREATTPDRLADIFRLRYRILRSSRIAGLCPDSPLEIDFDEFESHSHHYGVYLVDGEHEILAGCERGVFNHETEVAEAVRHEGYDLGLKWQTFELEPPTPFQCLHYWTDAAAIKEFCREVWSFGCEIGESTRFAITPEYRSPELSQFVVEAVIATCLITKRVDVGLTVVSSHHKPFYRRYGFWQIPGTGDAYLPDAEAILSCLAITRESIPLVRGPRLQALADQYLQHGCIRFQSRIPALARSESLSSAA